jgi:hypothetical protein
MAREPVLSKPRYEPRRLDAPNGYCTHGIFDSFDQSFVMAEHHSEAQAIRAARRYNDHYEEFILRRVAA